MQPYRLNPESLQKIIEQCRSLQESVGELLSQNVRDETLSHATDSYDDLSNFPQIQFRSERHRHLVALAQLAEHYPLGFFFEKARDHWSCQLLFTNGEIMELTSRRYFNPKLIPAMSPLQVKATPTREILDQLPLQLSGIDDCEETLLFRPASDSAFLVLSPLPRPFLGDLAEKTMQFLNRCFLP